MLVTWEGSLQFRAILRSTTPLKGDQGRIKVANKTPPLTFEETLYFAQPAAILCHETTQTHNAVNAVKPKLARKLLSNQVGRYSYKKAEISF